MARWPSRLFDELRRSPGDWHQHHAELRTHGIGFGEDAHNVLRESVSSDVVVGRLASKQQITNASADQVSLVVMIAERAYHLGGELLGVHSHSLQFSSQLTVYSSQFCFLAESRNCRSQWCAGPEGRRVLRIGTVN